MAIILPLVYHINDTISQISFDRSIAEYLLCVFFSLLRPFVFSRHFHWSYHIEFQHHNLRNLLLHWLFRPISIEPIIMMVEAASIGFMWLRHIYLKCRSFHADKRGIFDRNLHAFRIPFIKTIGHNLHGFSVRGQFFRVFLLGGRAVVLLPSHLAIPLCFFVRWSLRFTGQWTASTIIIKHT